MSGAVGAPAGSVVQRRPVEAAEHAVDPSTVGGAGVGASSLGVERPGHPGGPDASAPGRRLGHGIDKRLLDVVAGTVLAVAALPLIVVGAVAVCVSLRTRRPFFCQRRVGRHGRPFTVLKLRTLPLGAPAAVDKYALGAVATTRLGQFLRATHLDELPQLLLVPVGRMSLVGPRPEMTWLAASFDAEFVAARSAVRPGCTGLWQIGAAAGRLIGEAPEYDLQYLHHRSARLDVWILWKSVLVMAGGKRVTCADVPRWARRRQHATGGAPRRSLVWACTRARRRGVAA